MVQPQLLVADICNCVTSSSSADETLVNLDVDTDRCWPDSASTLTQRECQFATTVTIFRTPVNGVILLLHVPVMLYCTISALTECLSSNQVTRSELTFV